MEEEFVLSGFCRQENQTRRVTAEWWQGEWQVDCGYADCPHRGSCPVAEAIENLPTEE